MDFLKSIIISFSFFTTIPMPMIDWTKERMKFVPLILPLVGAVIGGLSFSFYKLVSLIGTGNILAAVLLSIFFLLITGGIHMDGLMDSADAYFSRRDRERRLEIMKDSRVGAFAVMAIIVVVLLKTAVFYELLAAGKQIGLFLIVIPVVSRLLQSSMLYFFPYAKEEGLAKMYGGKLKKSLGFILIFMLLVISTGMAVFLGIKALFVPGIAVLFYGFYYLSSKKHFGGITGDLLGAFLEMVELLMIGAVLFV